MNHIGTKEFYTLRLKLRRLKEDDALAMYSTWASDQDVTKFLTWDYHRNIESSKFIINMWLNEYEDNDTYRWGIELQESGELIGMIDVVHYDENKNPVIGYVLGQKYWGKGYMSEALKGVVNYLFNEASFNLIKAEAMKDNYKSQRVLEKNGFIKVGEKTEFLSLKNCYRTLVQYELRK